MKNWIMALTAMAVLMAPLDAVAQIKWDAGVHYAFIDPSGENDFTEAQARFDLDNGSGFGASIGAEVGSFSLQLAAYSIESDATLASEFPPADTFPLGSLKLMPVTATGRFHLLGGSSLSPFVGGGVAWVQADSLDDRNALAVLDLESIEFEDEVTWVAEAGIRLRINDRLELEAGAKYIPMTVDSTARFIGDPAPSDPVEIEINPMIISGGVILRF